MRTSSRELGFYNLCHCLTIQDACSMLAPFEEEAKMVSCDEVGIVDTVSLVLVLTHLA